MEICEFANEKGFKQVTGEDGKLIYNAVEYNGQLYLPFGDNMVDRLDSHKSFFPVFTGDICLLTYPKSGIYFMFAVG